MAIGAIILAVYTFKQSQQQTPTADTIKGGPAAVTTNVTTTPRPVQATRLAPDTSVKQLPSVKSTPNVDLEKEPNTTKRTMTIPKPPSDERSTRGATVSQKVVLYEEDQANPLGKQSVGSVMWRTDRPPSRGQKPEVTVRADIEIPEQNTTIRWSLRRNEDKSLPASHTVEIRFKLPADFPHGGISNIPGVLMKQGETGRGVPLNGVALKLTANFFVIGLSSVDADMQRNIQLLKERSWFDIPVVYGDGKRAIIAIEKGTPGERAFADAFDAWGTAISETKPPLTSPPPAPPVARLEPSPSSPTSSAPTSRGTLVPLHFEGGSFTVPVSINNKLTLDFVLDSGAADVSIPADVVSTLMRTGGLSAADFLGKQTYRLADGSTVSSQRFRIKSLKVGDKEMWDVMGSVAPVKGSLLLGQSFLSHFKSWSIDNNRRVLILE
jgi:clan AA aspartic protease (TIGR02281 family)